MFGRVSVSAMVEGRYTKSEKQRKLYPRRRLVIEEVKRLASSRTETEADVVKALDTYMRKHGLSMTKLQDRIKEREQERKTAAFWLDES